MADWGINQATTKSIASEESNFQSEYPKFFLLKLSSCFLFPFIVLIPGYIIGYTSHQLEMLFWISWIHAFIQLFTFYRANIQGFQLFKIDAFASNFDKLFLVIALSFLLFKEDFTIQEVINSRIISLALTIGLISIILLRYKAWLLPLIPKKGEAISLMKKALPFALIMFLYTVNERADMVMIERLAINKAETSYYSAGYRWLDAAMMYLWIILPLFFARFSFRDIALNEKSHLLKAGIGLTATPLIAIAIFSLFHGDLFFIMFENSSKHEIQLMTSCFQILCIVLLINGCFAILSTFLTSQDYTKHVNYLIIISIVFNITLNAIYIPQYGSIAAAYSTLASTSLLSFGYIFIFIKEKIFSLPYMTWVKIGGIFTASYFLGEFINGYNIAWHLFLVMIGFFVLGSSIATKLLDLSVLKNKD